MKLAFTTLLLIFSFPIFSTHITGGEITYKCTGRSIYYIINLTLFYDEDHADPSVNLKPGVTSVNIYDPVTDSLIQDEIFNLQNSDEIYSCNQGYRYNISLLKYRALVDLNDNKFPNGAKFVYGLCCRPHEVENLRDPMQEGFHLSTTIYPSREFLNFSNKIPGAFPINQPFKYDGSLSSTSTSDSAYYYLDHAASSGDIFNTDQTTPSIPISVTYNSGYSSEDPLGNPTDPVTIDPKTGEISGTAIEEGAYAVAYKVKNYHNGELVAVLHKELLLYFGQEKSDNSEPYCYAHPTGIYDNFNTQITLINNPDNANIILRCKEENISNISVRVRSIISGNIILSMGQVKSEEVIIPKKTLETGIYILEAVVNGKMYKEKIKI